jgi:hypothetical protein
MRTGHTQSAGFLKRVNKLPWDGLDCTGLWAQVQNCEKRHMECPNFAESFIPWNDPKFDEVLLPYNFPKASLQAIRTSHWKYCGRPLADIKTSTTIL